jgi:hypothetical protein
MITLDVTSRPRLKHHGKAKVVRERYQRPKIQDLGKKWKVVYWDYSTGASEEALKGLAEKGCTDTSRSAAPGRLLHRTSQ